MIMLCEYTLVMALARAPKKEYLEDACNSIATKSLRLTDADMRWDSSASSAAFDASVLPAPSVFEQIDAICGNLENYEEGDTLLGEKPINELKAILHEAEDAHDAPIRAGHVIPCYGELNVTWNYMDRTLMITAFSDTRQPRLDFGTTPNDATGEYGSDPTANGQKLAHKLGWLYGYTR